MRKTLKYLTIIGLLFCLNLTKVNAIKVGDTFVMNYSKEDQPGITYKSNKASYFPGHYSATYEGTSYELVCMDPGAAAPATGCNMKVIGTTPMTAESYGLSVIMNSGQSDYLAMSLAARAYTFTYMSNLMGSNGSMSEKNDIIKHAKFWEGKAAASAAGLSCSGSGCSVLENAKSIYLKGVEAKNSYTNQSGDSKPKVSVTVISGNDESGSDNSNSFDLNDKNEGDNNETTSAKTNKKTYIVEFKLTDFSKDVGYFSYDGYTAGNSSYDFSVKEIGVSFTRGTDASQFTEIISKNTNLFDTYSANVQTSENTKSLTFYMAIETSVTGNFDSDENAEVECGGNVKLNYSYKEPNLFQVVTLHSAKCTSTRGHASTNLQKFLAILAEGEGDEGQVVKESLDLGAMTCSSDPCQPALCKGDECEYNKTLPQICEDDATPDEDGNVEYKFLEAYQNGSYNIKKCIVKGAKDVVGNSYKLVDDENAATIADNPYCSVYCKEDYLLKVPYKRDTEQGRYFSLSFGLKGQQDCYSSEFNTEKYNEDVIAKTKEIVAALNEWSKNYELANNPLVNDEYDHTSICRKTKCKEVKSTDKNKPNTVTGCNSDGTNKESEADKLQITFGTNSNVQYYSVNETTGEVIVDKNAVPTDHVHFGSSENTAGSCSLSNNSCIVNSSDDLKDTKTYTCKMTTPTEDRDKNKEKYEKNMERAKSEVERLTEELKEIIDNYNSCTGDDNYEAVSKKFTGTKAWKMVYKFDPEIKYSYDEPNPTDTTIPKWIDEVKGLTCEDDTCDTMFSKDEKVTAEFCAGDDNEKCEALGAEGTVKNIFDEEKELPVNNYCMDNVNDDYTCAGTSTNTISDANYEDKPFFICTFENDIFHCEQEMHKVTKVKYLHKTAVSEGTYDTRRVYFTGHDNGDIKIEVTEEAPENYSLVDGLPVAADTPQGTYFYVLGINNIGQFYSTGELGRIFSSNESSISNYIHTQDSSTNNTVKITQDKNNEITKEIATNEYACSYTVSQNTCEDSGGNIHTRDECDFGEGGQDKDWESCKKRICSSGSNGSGYCVKTAESYYVCTTQNYDKESCTKYDSRASAIAASAENYNCCPECTTECVGKCLIVIKNNTKNDAQLQVDFRTISPSNMNPNSRKLGFNWDSENATNSLIAQKAGNTISEIEARASSGGSSNPSVETVGDYSLKVTMTSDMVNWIKEYNNEQISQGNYNNDSLTCYDYTLRDISSEDDCKKSGYIWENDKCIMANIFCYSDFIDDLSENFGDKVDAPNRDQAKSSANDNFQTYQSISGVSSGDQILTNDYWTIYKYSNLDVNGDGIPDIGPSWK